MVTRIQRMKSPKRMSDVILGIAVYGFTGLTMLLILIPLIHIVSVSISDGVAVQRGEVFLLPEGFSLESYEIIFDNDDLWRSYLNTIIYTVVGTVINLILTVLCAYPLSRNQFQGKKFFTIMVVITMFFSGGMIPSYLVVHHLGLLNTIWAIVLPVGINTWNMIVMRTFFQSLPNALMESAYIDGAGEWRTLYSIVIPLSKPILATIIMFYAVGHWNSFFSAILYLSEKVLYPVQVVLRNIVISGEVTDQLAQMQSSDQLILAKSIKYAVMVVVMAPIICIYPFVQKHFVRGVMIGSLKG